MTEAPLFLFDHINAFVKPFFISFRAKVADSYAHRLAGRSMNKPGFHAVLLADDANVANMFLIFIPVKNKHVAKLELIRF